MVCDALHLARPAAARNDFPTDDCSSFYLPFRLKRGADHRQWYTGIAPYFFARLIYPTGSHVNVPTSIVSEMAANACVQYTDPGGVMGSIRAPRLVWTPL